MPSFVGDLNVRYWARVRTDCNGRHAPLRLASPDAAFFAMRLFDWTVVAVRALVIVSNGNEPYRDSCQIQDLAALGQWKRSNHAARP